MGSFGVNTQQALAIGVLVLLTWVNTRGVRTGAMVQNVFTVAKTGALLGLIGFGFFAVRGTSDAAANFTGFWQNADWSLTTIRLVGVAMVGALFSADAWNNVTFTAGEVRNPRRNVPLALGLGVGSCVSALHRGEFRVSAAAAARGDSARAPGPRGNRRRRRHLRTAGGATHGRGHHDFDLRLH